MFTILQEFAMQQCTTNKRKLPNWWLTLKALHGLESHRNFELTLPKVEIIINWVTFLARDFQCTLPPMIRPIIEGVSM